ncbi:DUF3500 domain-containing protein [Candidatus Laterigemmans baculatus]|uniref:DUF3500 domain-containing protein n=1 Tax=Candidatus Laterigemmans baculatus TaxID=2770505 RepID=UPI0013DBBEF4|nr:DUF3500 domain-containing protein [Candidatus Laterigemmans baculatus]
MLGPRLSSPRFLRRLIPTTLVAATLGAITIAAVQQQSPAEGMQQYAGALLSTLNEAQKNEMLLPYGSDARVGWHFIPKDERKGVPLREMNDAQKAASMRLLRAALSEAGYTKATQIILLEGVLRELEGSDRRWARDPDGYYVTLFGEPAESDSPWGLSFEGHHLSLNFVCQGDKVVDSTPQFFGANPAIIRSDVAGPLGKGTRVLAEEEERAFQLIGMLSDAQKEKAIIAEEAPSEIRAAGEPQPPQEPPAGISYRDLNAEQIETLEKLVEVYATAMPEQVASERISAIRQAGWGNVHFAWAGATKPGIGHYYRIQGPTFLVEFINTQPDAEGNPANHIHCVWRDMTGDFALAQTPAAQP